jgi:protease I
MNIIMPLPARDFDPTESAVPWKLLTEKGHTLSFATPSGERPAADERMLTGRGLGPWRGILRARRDARDAYAEMEACPAFQAPASYESLSSGTCDGLLLPGGHAQGMKPYLEAAQLQRLVVEMFAADKPVAAICHGVLVVARSVDPATGKSVVHGRKTTALPSSMEKTAWAMTGLWLGSYYRTYPQTVQDEVVSALASASDFQAGPSALLRDAPDKLERGFVVRDGNYLSARWPGDTYRFATEFADMLSEASPGVAQLS